MQNSQNLIIHIYVYRKKNQRKRNLSYQTLVVVCIQNYKYSSGKHSLQIIKRNLSNIILVSYLNEVYDSLANLSNTNTVVEKLYDYMPRSSMVCKSKKAEAIRAEERVENYLDMQIFFSKVSTIPRL